MYDAAAGICDDGPGVNAGPPGPLGTLPGGGLARPPPPTPLGGEAGTPVTAGRLSVAALITFSTASGQNAVGDSIASAMDAAPWENVAATTDSGGRAPGSLRRQVSSTSRSLGGTPVSSGSPRTTRNSTVAAFPVPKGCLPVAA